MAEQLRCLPSKVYCEFFLLNNCCYSVVGFVVCRCCNKLIIGAYGGGRYTFPRCDWARGWQSCRYDLVGLRVDVNNKFCREKITDGLIDNKAVFEGGDKIFESKRLDHPKNIPKRDRVNIYVYKINNYNSVLLYEIKVVQSKALNQVLSPLPYIHPNLPNIVSSVLT